MVLCSIYQEVIATGKFLSATCNSAISHSEQLQAEANAWRQMV